MEDEPEKYQTHFSEYIKRGLEADDLEGLYKKVHAAIRADPSIKKTEKEPPKEHKRSGYLYADKKNNYAALHNVVDVVLINSFLVPKVC